MTIHADTAGIIIYVSAGFATASNFLDDFAAKLASRYEQVGKRVQCSCSLSVWRLGRAKRGQLQEIYVIYGIMRIAKNLCMAVKVCINCSQIRWRMEKLLFIGHSAGAVAAIMAAEELMQEGLRGPRSDPNWIPEMCDSSFAKEQCAVCAC